MFSTSNHPAGAGVKQHACRDRLCLLVSVLCARGKITNRSDSSMGASCSLGRLRSMCVGCLYVQLLSKSQATRTGNSIMLVDVGACCWTGGC